MLDLTWQSYMLINSIKINPLLRVFQVPHDIAQRIQTSKAAKSLGVQTSTKEHDKSKVPRALPNNKSGGDVARFFHDA